MIHYDEMKVYTREWLTIPSRMDAIKAEDFL